MDADLPELDDLADRAVSGDRDAVQQLIDAMRPVVVRYCRARIGRDDLGYARADDVAQEVCVSVLTGLPSYRTQDKSFPQFMYGIAAHKVAQAQRG